MAENEMIFIIPRAQLDQLDLIACKVPRMRPPQRSQVPIWLAILLKRQKRATIVPPGWLNREDLEKRLEEEKKTDEYGLSTGFAKMPFQWIEVSDLLLDVAADDIPDADIVQRLLRDLREARQQKARDGLEVLEDKMLQMDNIGRTEVNEIRALFSGSMDVLRALQETQIDEEEQGTGDQAMADDGNDSDD